MSDKQKLEIMREFARVCDMVEDAEPDRPWPEALGELADLLAGAQDQRKATEEERASVGWILARVRRLVYEDQQRHEDTCRLNWLEGLGNARDFPGWEVCPGHRYSPLARSAAKGATTNLRRAIDEARRG